MTTKAEQAFCSGASQYEVL